MVIVEFHDERTLRCISDDFKSKVRIQTIVVSIAISVAMVVSLQIRDWCCIA
jgi:uncharacterized membrane protein